jgi:hypothetical protein
VWIFIPKTNSTLLGKDRHDDYNVAGYGTSIKAGLDITFFLNTFTFKGIRRLHQHAKFRTTNSLEDSASRLSFFQRIIFLSEIQVYFRTKMRLL